jgi:transcription initiation factor TFIID TATA-box-binding protein
LLPKLSIVNVIATGEVLQFIDLERLVCSDGFLYDKAIYHCAYLKDQLTHSKVSIFASGKMISIGTKSVKSAKEDLRYASKRLSDIGLISPTRVKGKLQNLVATAELGHAIDIEKLARELPHIVYEPEQFPGAIYHADELEGASILIFANGKVVVAGLKRENLLETARRVLVKLAEEISETSVPRATRHS